MNPKYVAFYIEREIPIYIIGRKDGLGAHNQQQIVDWIYSTKHHFPEGGAGKWFINLEAFPSNNEIQELLSGKKSHLCMGCVWKNNDYISLHVEKLT